MNDIETSLQELVREFDETVFPKDYRHRWRLHRQNTKS